MTIEKNEIKNIISMLVGEKFEIQDDEELVIYGVDSMMTMKLIVELEEKFNIIIPEETLLYNKFNTINKIYSFLSTSKAIHYNCNSMKSKDKIAVVTGANRGVGYGIACALYQDGYKVISLNRTCIGVAWMDEIQCDIKNSDEIKKAVSIIKAQYDGIDLLVNNAGVREFARADHINEEQWDETFKVNFMAPLNLTCLLLKSMVKRNGFVVFVGSSAHNNTFEGGAAYSCSKSALYTLTESLIKDFRYEDIRMSYISLGSTEIDATKEAYTWKIKPIDVGQLICMLQKLPDHIMPAYIDLRPSKPKRSIEVGLERLQII